MLTCDFGTAQKRFAVKLSLAEMIVPSARSMLFDLPIIPGIPYGGFETATDNGTAVGPPPLVSRNSKFLVCPSYTVPNVKEEVVLSKGTQPEPSGVWNSTTALGCVPALPSRTRLAEPPLENAVR